MRGLQVLVEPDIIVRGNQRGQELDSEIRDQGKGWKQQLLLSGVPLEYEVARILAQHGMSVHADFSYMRKDSGEDKECSIDIYSTWYSTGRSGNIKFSVEFLIECKYRSPHKSILFLSDPNIEFPPMTLGGTVGVLDVGFPFHISTTPLTDFESGFDFAYKAIEIFEKGATENEFRRGIEQLRYASPVMISDLIWSAFTEHDEDSHPRFMVKMLVTNAPMRLMNLECGIDEIQGASNISDISELKDRVIYYSGFGPDFREHVSSVFGKSKDRMLSLAKQVKGALSYKGKRMSGSDDPVEFVEELISARHFSCSNIGSQFFIVNIEGLPSMLSDVKVACSKAFKRQTKDVPWKRRFKG